MNEIMIMDNQPEVKTQSKFTLKVLFGPLLGCELHLPAEDYFLLISPSPALSEGAPGDISATDHAATYTQNTLYLPCDFPSPNLTLHLSSNGQEGNTAGSYSVDVHDKENSCTLLLTENEVFSWQHIRFAIKRSDDEWVPGIKNFSLTPVVSEQSDSDYKLEAFNAKRRRTLLLSGGLLVTILLVAAFIWFKKFESEQRVLSLNELLAGAPVPLQIAKARDGDRLYVVTENYQAMEWAQEALHKTKENNDVRSIWLPQHKKELRAKLNDAGFPVLQIDFSEPQHPIVALWQEISSQQLEKLKQFLFKQSPFAADIRTSIRTKRQLLEEARQGLDRLHIHYRQVSTTSGYALVIRDALSDNVLNALQRFITGFDHQWGSHVVNFSINLDEDWLKNKSYLDSSNGYLFLNPRHWYFPLKQGDIK